VSIAEPLLLNPQHEQYTTLHGTHPLLTGKNGKELKMVRKRKGLTGKEGMRKETTFERRTLFLGIALKRLIFLVFLFVRNILLMW